MVKTTKNNFRRICSASLMLAVLPLSGCGLMSTNDAPPAMPVNISPLVEANIVVNSDITFVWAETETAREYHFHIYNRSNRDATQYLRRGLYPKDVCSDGQCSITLNVSLPVLENHAWRVRAGNNVGWSSWNRSRFNMVGF